MSSGVYTLSSGVYTVVGNRYVTAYGNGMLPLMVMVCYRLCNRFGQPS